jgi:tryptophanyl-tRNA synthetase
VLPEAQVDDKTAVLQGLDGRKMSKSYNNTIPLFAPENRLRKLIMKITTTSQGPDEPKDAAACTLFQIYQAFATPSETEALRARYASGIAWSEMKQMLFEYLNDHLAEARKRYGELIQDPAHIENVLREGALKARAFSVPFLKQIREAIGVQSIG